LKDNNTNLTPKHEKAIMALLTEPTIRQAADTTGIGETTLFRWMQDKDFIEAFKEARRMAFSQAISRLQQVSTQAVNTLLEVMSNEEAPATSRVSAAKTVLEMSIKAFETEDLSDRVEEMERYIEESRETG
jgi:predicted DNA-binding transcriptional regulator AlpA